MGAIQAVLDVIRKEKANFGRRHEFFVVVALDIENAFNSARSIDFIMSLVQKEVPEYLVRSFDDYVNERIVLYGDTVTKMTEGATQRSKMRPDR